MSDEQQVNDFFAEVGAAIDGPGGEPNDGAAHESGSPDILSVPARDERTVDVEARMAINPATFGQELLDTVASPADAAAKRAREAEAAKPDPNAPYLDAIGKLSLPDPGGLGEYIKAVAPEADTLQATTPESAAALVALAERARLLEHHAAGSQQEAQALAEAAQSRETLDDALARYYEGEGEESPEEIASELAAYDHDALRGFVASWAEDDPDAAEEWASLTIQQAQYEAQLQAHETQQQLAAEQQRQYGQVLEMVRQAQQVAAAHLETLPPRVQAATKDLVTTLGPAAAGIIEQHGLEPALRTFSETARAAVEAEEIAAMQNAIVQDDYKLNYRLPTPPTIEPTVNLAPLFEEHETVGDLFRSFGPSPMQKALLEFHEERQQALAAREAAIKGTGR